HVSQNARTLSHCRNNVYRFIIKAVLLAELFTHGSVLDSGVEEDPALGDEPEPFVEGDRVELARERERSHAAGNGNLREALEHRAADPLTPAVAQHRHAPDSRRL